jgi:hypothetical protein
MSFRYIVERASFLPGSNIYALDGQLGSGVIEKAAHRLPGLRFGLLEESLEF